MIENFLDFSQHGYQLEKELGHNSACGRVTYLATSINTQRPVVIKQFQFAQLGGNWSHYDSVEREIQLLRHLNHPSIPRYLDSFQTTTGFCLVQEYKQAPSLAQAQLFKPEEIKQIAIAILEVLVYLQQQIPPVIHRDIKPENILVDRQDLLKIYLVDFGFARSGGGEVAVSSVVKGTLGFMPPEQLFNRQVTEASDLYSLGATLICLLTKTKSTEIGNLIDENYRINFKHLLPQLSPDFIQWLTEMVAPNLKDRFDNAVEALEVISLIDVVKKTTQKDPLAAIQKHPLFKASAVTIGTGLFLATSSTILGLIAENLPIREEVLVHREPMVAPSTFFQEPLVEPRELTNLFLKTRQCPGCNLSGVNLQNRQLESANLNRASLNYGNLEKVNLQRADLRGATLLNANLKNAKLSGANLGYANLESSILEGANLSGANLWGAKLGDYVNLRNANLKGANLASSYMTGAYLGNADLRGVNLQGSSLTGAFLGGANLGNAKLIDTDLTGANLANTNFENANLQGVKLENANLLGAYMEGVDLRESYLENADLRGANLINANLKGAYLRGANLRGANLKGANLNGANLRNANLKGATMPNGSIYK